MFSVSENYLPGAEPLDPLGDEPGGEIMGRPKLSETALRRHVLTVRLNDGEHEELRRQAGKARLRVSEPNCPRLEPAGRRRRSRPR